MSSTDTSISSPVIDNYVLSDEEYFDDTVNESDFESISNSKTILENISENSLFVHCTNSITISISSPNHMIQQQESPITKNQNPVQMFSDFETNFINSQKQTEDSSNSNVFQNESLDNHIPIFSEFTTSTTVYPSLTSLFNKMG